MGKDLFNYLRIFDTCDDLDGATACVTGRYVDIEYSFHALCPAHGGVTKARYLLFGRRLSDRSISGFLNDRCGHLVRIRDSDSNGGFQIAAVPDSDQIGKFRHIGVIQVNQKN
jgi:hypothetical protein